MLPQRQLEILHTLLEHPLGLTTAEITKLASAKPGAELPDDTAIASNLIYQLRNNGYLTSHDQTGNNKRKHVLTEQGRITARPLMCEEDPAARELIEAVETKTESIAEYLETGFDTQKDYLDLLPVIEDTHEQPADNIGLIGFDLADPLENALHDFCGIVKESLTAPAVSITDKRKKIDALYDLVNIVRADRADLLMEIIEDLKKLEESA